MNNKTRSVIAQIVAVAIVAVALSVYSLFPKKTEDAQMRLRVLQAHRNLKAVLSAVQEYAADHNGRFPSLTVASHSVRAGTYAVSNVVDAAHLLEPAYLDEIPKSPFAAGDGETNPIQFGRASRNPGYWYVYTKGPGEADAPTVALQDEPPALPSNQWYAVTNGLRSPGYLFRDTFGFVSMGSTR